MSLQEDNKFDIYFQHTLNETLIFVGHGLHSDHQVEMRILPAEPNSGIVFVRSDVNPEHAEIPASWYKVIDTHLCTTLGNPAGVHVSTVEHLMAALYACGVDNARIIINGPEVPILDGSALPFVSRIHKAGTVRQPELRRAILIKSSISTCDMEKHASFHPSPVPWISLEIDFDSTVIGRQLLSLPVDLKTFREELAPARTFGFEDQVNALRDLGFARGGTLHNSILIKDNKIVNEDGLRYVDEFVRHKALDSIGDMALAGARIVGQFSGCRTGHKLNIALLRELMLRNDCWEYTTLLDAHAYWKRTNVITRVNINKSSKAGVEFEFVTKSQKVTKTPLCESCEAPIGAGNSQA